MKVEFKIKDKNNHEGTTTYWFELTGEDFGTGCKFESDIFGVCEGDDEGDDEGRILDCDGCPMTRGDREEIAAARHCVVTAEMRAA